MMGEKRKYIIRKASYVPGQIETRPVPPAYQEEDGGDYFVYLTPDELVAFIDEYGECIVGRDLLGRNRIVLDDLA